MKKNYKFLKNRYTIKTLKSLKVICILWSVMRGEYMKIKNFLSLRRLNIGRNWQIDYPANFLGLENVYIGHNFSARRNLKLRCFRLFQGETFNSVISIGNNVSIETNCTISAIKGIVVGDNVLIASNVFISDHMHGEQNFRDMDAPPLSRKLSSKGIINIENNVWIGENVVILGGVNIGANSIIAASSVVNKNIPCNCIAAGIPAKVVKRLK